MAVHPKGHRLYGRSGIQPRGGPRRGADHPELPRVPGQAARPREGAVPGLYRHRIADPGGFLALVADGRSFLSPWRPKHGAARREIPGVAGENTIRWRGRPAAARKEPWPALTAGNSPADSRRTSSPSVSTMPRRPCHIGVEIPRGRSVAHRCCLPGDEGYVPENTRVERLVEVPQLPGSRR